MILRVVPAISCTSDRQLARHSEICYLASEVRLDLSTCSMCRRLIPGTVRFGPMCKSRASRRRAILACALSLVPAAVQQHTFQQGGSRSECYLSNHRPNRPPQSPRPLSGIYARQTLASHQSCQPFLTRPYADIAQERPHKCPGKWLCNIRIPGLSFAFLKFRVQCTDPQVAATLSESESRWRSRN